MPQTRNIWCVLSKHRVFCHSTSFIAVLIHLPPVEAVYRPLPLLADNSNFRTGCGAGKRCYSGKNDSGKIDRRTRAI